MRRRLLAVSFVVALPAAVLAAPSSADIPVPDIPYQKYVLKNGLTLIVHEDHKAPIVAVNVWYHVGSKNEKPGKTGFAHLFEHLMFNGSEHFNDDYFKALREGRRHRPQRHHQPGPHQLLPERADRARSTPSLWMESDRMGHLLGAIDQARLDEQRGRGAEREAAGREPALRPVTRQLLTENVYPTGHPYSWTVDRLDGGPERGLARRRARSGSRPTTARPTPCSSSPAT